jgi:hypothetical protein
MKKKKAMTIVEGTGYIRQECENGLKLHADYKPIFTNLTTPFKFKDGGIVDGFHNVLISADQSAGTLLKEERDALLELVVVLLNESFQYDKADQILRKLGYPKG